MDYQMESIDIIIEEYIDKFRKLLIILLKDKKINNKNVNIKEKKKYNYCLHPNYKGKKCKRMVKNHGEICIFHKSKSNTTNNNFKKDIKNKNIEQKYNIMIDGNNDNEHDSLDKNNNSLNNLIYPSNDFLNENNSSKNNEILNDKYVLSNNKVIHKYDNLLDKKEHDLLKIINAENNKLICYECKKTLTTIDEINNNLCYNCYHFPFLSRNNSLTKCKSCINNTLNLNRTCNNCFKIELPKENTNNVLLINKTNKTICSKCKLSRTFPNQSLCNQCYKNNKRKIKIY